MAFPPQDDPLGDAAFSETSVDVLIGQAEIALDSGDTPRAKSLAETALRRTDLDRRDQADAWKILLRVGGLTLDEAAQDRALQALVPLLSEAELRGEIRGFRIRSKEFPVGRERDLLASVERLVAASRQAEPSASEGAGGLTRSRYRRAGGEGPGESAASAAAPPAEEVVRRMSEDEERESEGETAPPVVIHSQSSTDAVATSFPTPDDDELEDIGGELPLLEDFDLPYSDEDLQGVVLRSELPMPKDEGPVDLPFLESELRTKSAAEIHRYVAEHPGTSALELLRRYAAAQSQAKTAEELEQAFGHGVDAFHREAYEIAVEMLIPVATIPNKSRLGALELLAQALLELDRLDEAEAYLDNAIPAEMEIADKAYASLLFWRGQVAEEKKDMGAALYNYVGAVRLDPSMAEPKMRIRVLTAV